MIVLKTLSKQPFARCDACGNCFPLTHLEEIRKFFEEHNREISPEYIARIEIRYVGLWSSLKIANGKTIDLCNVCCVPTRKRYAEYLDSPFWKTTRMEKIKRVGCNCEQCNSAYNLSVHHLTYRNLGHEDIDNDLIVLCQECHQEVHIIDIERKYIDDDGEALDI